MSIMEQLSAPFAPEKVSWRVGSTTKDKSKGMALAYIDARDVMERLDSAVGPERWQRRYSHADKKTICEIGIRIDHHGGWEWIWKSDGAGDSDIEAEKGAISDAFKRAAVNWGIGRYLYDIESPWVALNEYKQIEKSEYAKLRAVLAGKAPPEPVKPAQRPELTEDQKAAAALEHANIHAEGSQGYDKLEYANANRDILTRIAKYPEAKAVLKDAGLV